MATTEFHCENAVVKCVANQGWSDREWSKDSLKLILCSWRCSPGVPLEQQASINTSVRDLSLFFSTRTDEQWFEIFKLCDHIKLYDTQHHCSPPILTKACSSNTIFQFLEPFIFLKGQLHNTKTRRTYCCHWIWWRMASTCFRQGREHRWSPHQSSTSWWSGSIIQHPSKEDTLLLQRTFIL